MVKKQKIPKGSGAGESNDAVITDPRFANIQSDPRYRLPSKRNTTVKLDKRFSRMLHDEEFSKNAAVDRYGRKLKRDDTKRQLEVFYRLEDNDEDEDAREKKEKKDKKAQQNKKQKQKLQQQKDETSSSTSSSEESEEEESNDADDDLVQRELAKANKRSFDPSYNPARGGGFSESSSSESSSTEDSDEEEEDEREQEREELEYHQRTGIPMGEVTNRIAIVNLDWDNIRAEDLMVALSSFAPGGKGIGKVTVYPSEFGKERLEREATEGPPRELFADTTSKKNGSENDNNDNDSESSDSGSSDDEEKIREQLLQEDEGKEFDET
ncbi:pre-rRNA-processing protein esf1, partial [Ascosphaera aggregata]